MRVRRILLYLVFLLAMVFSGLELGKPVRTRAAGDDCCSYGQDCKTKSAPRCCDPTVGEAPCSEAKRNYCRANSCN